MDSKTSNSDCNKAQNILHNMNVRDRAGVLNQIPSFSTMDLGDIKIASLTNFKDEF